MPEVCLVTPADILRMNGVALILCTMNEDFKVKATRLIAGTGSEEDKKDLAWQFIKATNTFNLSVFEKWLTEAQL